MTHGGGRGQCRAHVSPTRTLLALPLLRRRGRLGGDCGGGAPRGVSHVRNIKGQFNLARPRLQSILIPTAVTEELIFDLSEVGPGPVNHCNSH